MPSRGGQGAEHHPDGYLGVWWQSWTKSAFGAMVLAIMLHAITPHLPSLLEFCSAYWQSSPEDICIDSILASRAGDVPDGYVPRPSLDSSFAKYVANADVRYVVSVGPRGCGKSVGIVAAAQNHAGVISITFSGDKDASDVYNRVLAKVCPGFLAPGALVDERFLKDLFGKAITSWKQQGGQGFWVPTIIAELDRGSTDGVVVDVAKAIKRLGSDTKSCRAVLVLGDAHAAFALPKDDDRIELLWVDDFTYSEAHLFLDKADFFLTSKDSASKAQREDVFHRIGTRAARLERMVAKVHDQVELDYFVRNVTDDARDILVRLTKPDLSMKSPSAEDMKHLVFELLDSPSSTVLASTLPGVLSKPNEVAPLLKKYHAVLYHYPSKTYRFYSPAYYHAAVEMFGSSRDEPKKANAIPSVWVQVVDKKGNEVGDITQLELSSEANVDKLREAVLLKMSKQLSHYDANQLRVFAAGANLKTDKPLQPDKLVSSDTTYSKPLIIVAPGK